MRVFLTAFWLRLTASAFVATAPLAWAVSAGLITFGYALALSATQALTTLVIWDGTRRPSASAVPVPFVGQRATASDAVRAA